MAGIARGIRAEKEDLNRQNYAATQSSQELFNRGGEETRQQNTSRTQSTSNGENAAHEKTEPRRPIEFDPAPLRKHSQKVRIVRQESSHGKPLRIVKDPTNGDRKTLRIVKHGSVYDDLPLAIPHTEASSQFVPGFRSIVAILKARRRRCFVLYVSPRHLPPIKDSLAHELITLARTNKVRIDRAERPFLEAMVRGQGDRDMEYGSRRSSDDKNLAITDDVVLECSPIPVVPTHSLSKINDTAGVFEVERADQLLAQHRTIEYAATWRQPLILWLHELTNTSNIAALARSAVFFGLDALAVSKRATSDVVKPASLRAGAGALEHIPILSIDNPADFISGSQKSGWNFLATVPPRWKGSTAKSSRPVMLENMVDTPVRQQPTVVVLGNEDYGLPPLLVEQMDAAISIQGTGAEKTGVDSLNVGVAGGIICERLVRRSSARTSVPPFQRGFNGGADDLPFEDNDLDFGIGKGKKDSRWKEELLF